MDKQLKEHLDKRSPSDWLFFVLGFVIFAAISWWVTPAILYAEMPQPFNFNHKLHMEQVGEGCKSCHKFREDGSFNGIPALESCTECHSEEPMGETEDEKIFIENYLKPGKPIPWQVYAKQPACVFFSHAAHAESAGFECAKCHGVHGETEVLRPYEQNRLTGYSRDIWGWSMLPTGGPPERMKMDDCADCHRENGVRAACFVCHK